LLASVAASCTGAIGDTVNREAAADGTSRGASTPTSSPPGSAGGPAGSGTPGGGIGSGVPGVTLGDGPALMPLARLGRTEYESTIRDLLGASVSARVTLPQEPVGPSSYTFASEIGGVERDLFEQGAQNAAAAATIPACSGGNERACAGDFVQTFGKRAFRRPLLDTESAQLLALYDGVQAAPIGYAHADALRTVVSAILQTPQFLYHWELGPQKPNLQGGLVALGPWEIASRLSYLIWGTMPDATLFQAAESHGLDGAAGIETQARRLLADRRGAHFAVDVFSQWVGMSKLAGLLKDRNVIASFSDSLKAAIQGETEQFIAKVVLESGTLEALLTSRESFVNGPLSAIYGMKGITGDAFRAQTLPGERSGLFTRSAFLAIKALPQESSPVHRGKVVSTRLLCNPILPPPPTLNVTPPPAQPGQTTRQRYDVHGKTPGCAACHAMMDPYGFAFESFDAAGQLRTTDAGQPVDASGSVTVDGKPLAFSSAAELMTGLAASSQVQGCVASQFMAFALSRSLVARDRAPLDVIVQAFRSSGADMRAMVVAFVTSDAFRFRAPAANEVTQ
jgi:hypothetical protein